MLKKTLSTILMATAAMFATPVVVYAQDISAAPVKKAATAKTVKSGRIEVDGIQYHYQIRGQGEPLLLLHGGLGSVDMFAPIMPVLAAKRQIIGVDLQGHGRTPLGSRPISMVAMGSDMAAILQKLGYGPVDVMGYSMGAGVAFQLAVQHPKQVRRLALVSGSFAKDGFYPEMIEAQAQISSKMAQGMKDTPMYKSYVAVAPSPDGFPKLLDAMGDMMKRPFDWSADVPKLTMPVLLVYGDSDMYRPEHVVKFYQLLGGGLKDAGWQRENMSRNRLAILPGLTHYDIFLSPQLPATVLPFLDGKTSSANWAR
ncbi:alpha/beta hydrolase [Roseateles sp.]|uniref:alpha/beta fold hydrolase n=1 Tax=Roseateles sp. TaxID=1971397 RepID=UPI00286C8490|nr:alpha/beta hydrolase [Roseateles sp.]